MTAGPPIGMPPDDSPSPGRASGERPTRRGPRRAVRVGTGERDPLVDLRADDDLDVGWQAPSDADGNDERLRRDVPPHW